MCFIRENERGGVSCKPTSGPMNSALFNVHGHWEYDLLQHDFGSTGWHQLVYVWLIWSVYAYGFMRCISVVIQCLKQSPARSLCLCHMINGRGFFFSSPPLIHEHLFRILAPHDRRKDVQKLHFSARLSAVGSTSKNYWNPSQESFPSVKDSPRFDNSVDQIQMDVMKNSHRRSSRLHTECAMAIVKLAEEKTRNSLRLNTRIKQRGTNRITLEEQVALKLKHTFDRTFRTRLHSRRRMHIETTLSICRFDNAQTL